MVNKRTERLEKLLILAKASPTGSVEKFINPNSR